MAKKKLKKTDIVFFRRVVTGLLVAQYIYANTPMYLGTAETNKMFNNACMFTDEFQRFLQKEYGLSKIDIDKDNVNETWYEIKKLLKIKV